jgi:hypothetical protein
MYVDIKVSVECAASEMLVLAYKSTWHNNLEDQHQRMEQIFPLPPSESLAEI